MTSTLDIDAYITVRSDCGIRCVPMRDEQVEVVFGPQWDACTMLFTRTGLQAFVTAALEALQRPADDERDPVVGSISPSS